MVHILSLFFAHCTIRSRTLAETKAYQILARLDLNAAAEAPEQESRAWRILRKVGTRFGLGNYFRPPRVVKPTTSPRRGSPQKRGNRPKTLRKDLLPFLSQSYGHKTHDGCFVAHLVDAVRVHTLKQRLEKDLQRCEQQILAAHLSKQDATISLSRLRTEPGGVDEMQYLIPEQERRIVEDSLKSSNDRIQKAKDVKTKLFVVDTYVRKCLRAVFDTFDHYYPTGGEVPLNMPFGLALQKCRKCQGDLEAEEDAFRNAASSKESVARQRHHEAEHVDENLQGSTSPENNAVAMQSSALPPITGPSSTPVAKGRTPREILGALNTLRLQHVALTKDFLGREGPDVLAERAHLKLPLTEEAPGTFRPRPRPKPSSTTSLSMRPRRGSDGRPLLLADPSALPLLDPTLHGLIATLRTAKSSLALNIAHRTSLRDKFLRTYLKYLIAFPRSHLDTFEKVYRTPENLPYRQRAATLSGDYHQALLKHDDAKAKVSAHLDQAPVSALKVFDTFSLDAHSSDWNVSSEGFERREAERTVGMGDLEAVRDWRMGVARNCEVWVRPDDVSDVDGKSRRRLKGIRSGFIITRMMRSGLRGGGSFWRFRVRIWLDRGRDARVRCEDLGM